MNIVESWFYTTDRIGCSEQITIREGVNVWLVLDESRSHEIILKANAKLDLYIISERWDVDISVIQEAYSELKLRQLIFWSDVQVQTKNIISEDNAISNIQIVSIVNEWWNIGVDGVIDIREWLSGVKARLEEDNILLGNTAKVRWIPTLLVASDDVEASHACKMEKISDEKLFYLRSRWVWKENALNMMLEARIKSLFSCLIMYNKELYEEMMERVLIKIA